jgi:GH35 family endo-1,4-beta-xylanase
VSVVSRVGVLAVVGVLLATSCSPQTDEATPSPTVASPTPTVTAEPEPEEITVPRAPIFQSIDDGFLGMHVAGVHEGAFPARRVPVTSVRLWDTGTSWAQIEIERGRYNWSGLDRALSTAEAAGVDDILMILGPTPTWNARTTEGVHYPLPGAASVPRSFASWDAFVAATVDRYAGRINSYQIWNEASLRMFWRGSGQTLARLTKRAYDIIKERDPEAKVVAASTTVRLPGAYERFFPAYLGELANLGWPIDVIAVHSYPTGEQDPNDRAQNLRTTRQTLEELGAPDFPVWDTELNYGLAGPGPIGRTAITGQQAKDWTVRTYLDSFKYDIDRTYWYIWTPDPYDLLGIQMTNQSAAAGALRTVADWLVDAEWGGCIQEGSMNSCAVRKNGVVSELLWTDQGEVTIADVRLGSEICDTNNDCQLAQESELTVTTAPLRLSPLR